MKYFEEIDFENLTDEEIDEFYRPRKQNNRRTLAPLFVYFILKEHSAPDHRLSQGDIIESARTYGGYVNIKLKPYSEAYKVCLCVCICKFA